MDFVLTKLSDCCTIKPPKSQVKKTLSYDALVSFVPMKNLGIDTQHLTLDLTRKLSDVSSSYTYFADNDVLLAKITPCFENGKLGLARDLKNGIGFGSSEFIVFRTSNELIPEYLYYFLSQPIFREKGKPVMTGAVGHKRVPKDFIENTEIPLPCINEQKRIVNILDQTFADIETARANAEQNLKNAHELFESCLQQVFSQRGEEWIKRPLEKLCNFKHGFAFKSEFFVDMSDHVLLTPGNFYEEGGYRDRGEKQKYYQGVIPDGFILSQGDLLVAMTEQAVGLLGSPALIPEDNKFLHNQRLGLVELKNEFADLIDLGFLFHLFNTKHFRSKVQETASGVKVRHTSPKKMMDIHIWFPTDIQIQKNIAVSLNQMKTYSIQLEEKYKRKLEALDELKQSILKKAFSGELTVERETSPEYTANVIAFAYYQHAAKKRDKTFGRVKAQKTLHLTESLAGIELGRNPTKAAAGPNDFDHMLRAEDWAKKNLFFKFVKRTDGGYDFIKLKRFDEWITKASSTLRIHQEKLLKVIDLMIPMNSKEAEVFATAHAAWNNLILDGKEITDEAIIHEARENWHQDKLKIPMAAFQQAINDIRTKQLIPDGTAKRVVSVGVWCARKIIVTPRYDTAGNPEGQYQPGSDNQGITQSIRYKRYRGNG